MNKINWPSWPNFGEDEYLAVDRVIKSNQLFAATEVKNFEKIVSMPKKKSDNFVQKIS